MRVVIDEIEEAGYVLIYNGVNGRNRVASVLETDTGVAFPTLQEKKCRDLLVLAAPPSNLLLSPRFHSDLRAQFPGIIYSPFIRRLSILNMG